MANICTINYVIEGERNELDALYETMKNLQGQALGQLVKAFETAWTPCYEVTDLLKVAYPSIRIYYKAVEPGCEVYLKNDAEGKYYPETEEDGNPFQLMTEEQEKLHARIIRGIIEGDIKIEENKP